MQITLYEFALGDRKWHYTSNTEDVIDQDSVLWEAATISNGRIKQSGEAVSDAVSLTTSRDIIPAQIWRLTPPTGVMTLRILRGTLDRLAVPSVDTGAVTTIDPRRHDINITSVRYVGEIAQCSEEEPGTITFSIETLAATMSRAGLRLGWQRQCPHAIYDVRTCKLSKAAYQVDGTVTFVSGSLVTIPESGAFAANYFAGGFLEHDHPVKGTEVLPIEASSGDVVTIFGYTTDLWPGVAVRLFPGCNQTPARCQEYGNYLNYGGIPDLPGKSPFNGVESPVF